MWAELALATIAVYAVGVAAQPRVARWLTKRRQRRYPAPKRFRRHQDGEPLGYRLYEHTLTNPEQ